MYRADLLKETDPAKAWRPATKTTLAPAKLRQLAAAGLAAACRHAPPPAAASQTIPHTQPASQREAAWFGGQPASRPWGPPATHAYGADQRHKLRSDEVWTLACCQGMLQKGM